MKKIFLLSFLSSFVLTKTIAQNNYPDSLKQLIYSGKDDTLKARRMYLVSSYYIYRKPDSGWIYAKNALELSQKLNYSSGEAISYANMGQCLSQLGNYPQALSFSFKALSLFRSLNSPGGVILTTEAIGTHYRDQGDYQQALKYLQKAQSLTKAIPDNATIDLLDFFSELKVDGLTFQSSEIGFCYLTVSPDSALFYAKKSSLVIKALNIPWIYPLIVIGNAFEAKNQPDSALYYYRLGLPLISDVAPNDAADIYIGISNVFKNKRLYDSSVFYAKKGLESCQNISYQKGVYQVSGILASVYEYINPIQSIKYYKLNKATYDSLFNQQKTREAQSFAFNEQLHQQDLQQKLEQADLVYRNRLNIYFLLAGLVILIIVAGGLWRRNIFKQKSFALLQKQKQETDNQKQKVEKTLEELKSTQAQLIQSEKMASLGELTAGIAHEIQNPLNFVNNFSEVNTELIDELKTELTTGNTKQAIEIAGNIKENEEKINHHGKRADAIVKNMLQHSRTSNRQKEPTDINALADEYLRLSYHGLRAKDNKFNATLKTDFDESIGNINIIPQDMGRVLLNLYNNAFYAVTEKKKLQSEGYEPTVSVSTKKIGDKVEIKVADNGNGIPQKVLDKIFQPFFTTKPTGQGTGLGLSLSYDIIKAHGGEIKVETKEGDGSEFTIQLHRN
jgi:two-component system, NtrC family, sensor kinase